MPDARRRSPGNGELGRGLCRREKNAAEAGAGRFEKPTPDARAAPPEAHESRHQPEDREGSAIDRAILKLCELIIDAGDRGFGALKADPDHHCRPRELCGVLRERVVHGPFLGEDGGRYK